MIAPMPYRFRLRVAAKQTGKFAFGTNEETIDLQDGLALSLIARNAETLDKATVFHFEAGGFATEESARIAGEALRVRLRLLNALLGIGLNVPRGDLPAGQVSDEIKRKVADENDAVVIDGVWGLTTFPDDGRHFEYVFGGNLEVRPSDPAYIFTALQSIWLLPIQLDKPSEDALQVLGLATLEASDKAAFLTSYLALEQLIEQKPRSEAAKILIARFQRQVEQATRRVRAPLPDTEAKSLAGALAALCEESFSSALTRFGHSVKTPATIKGMPVQKFFSACIAARNRIAHHAEPSTKVPLTELSAGLRETIIGIIWTRNDLPPLSVSIPTSAISFPAGALSTRVL